MNLNNATESSLTELHKVTDEMGMYGVDVDLLEAVVRDAVHAGWVAGILNEEVCIRCESYPAMPGSCYCEYCMDAERMAWEDDEEWVEWSV
jgi:hypothetical protein